MPSPLDHELMSEAIDEARTALLNAQLPVGAIVADRAGTVLGRGCKSGGNHWRLDHAEMVTLRRALPNRSAGDGVLADLTLYTTLEPCLMCIGGIANCRIPRVLYALEDPYGGGVRLLRAELPPRHEYRYPDVVGGVLRDESIRLFRMFFRETLDPFWQKQDNPLVRLCMGP